MSPGVLAWFRRAQPPPTQACPPAAGRARPLCTGGQHPPTGSRPRPDPSPPPHPAALSRRGGSGVGDRSQAGWGGCAPPRPQPSAVATQLQSAASPGCGNQCVPLQGSVGTRAELIHSRAACRRTRLGVRAVTRCGGLKPEFWQVYAVRRRRSPGVAAEAPLRAPDSARLRVPAVVCRQAIAGGQLGAGSSQPQLTAASYAHG
jgi:hypothetical protein